jgi:carbon-monoxide dehydrogenase large subunit
MLSGSFMDYALPRADLMPKIVCERHPVACTTNPLGAKGIGEAGTIGSTPAVVNAVVDALKPFGVDHVDMMLRPEKIWRIMQGGTR